jgi:glucosamine-6-phosphate deaminase
MKFIISNDYEEMSKAAANIIIEQIKFKSTSVLGLATGSTPVGMYKYLAEAYKKGLDFSDAITFNLDEYYGLPADHPQSYCFVIFFALFLHIITCA